MSDYRFQIVNRQDIVSLHILIDGEDGETHIPVTDIEAAIARYHQEQCLVARKRTVHGLEQYWIGRGKGKDFVLYHDIYSPTGYGFRGKAKAEQIASEIEERLRKEKEERKQSW